jgi:hypothetical protein
VTVNGPYLVFKPTLKDMGKHEIKMFPTSLDREAYFFKNIPQF